MAEVTIPPCQLERMCQFSHGSWMAHVPVQPWQLDGAGGNSTIAARQILSKRG
ncbi:hypothetical protein A2U01_0110217, partial [Trifolium medium]|nr:hypothetical protein [Trifolium medium]